MKSRRILLPFYLLLLPALLPAQRSQDEAIALEYSRQAVDLLQEGLRNEAFLLAGRGLSFDATSSDLHYLRAVSGAHRQEETPLVRAHLETALALDSWRLTDAQDGLRSLLSLLLRIGEFEAAEALLPDLRFRRPVDYRLAAQLLRVSGRFQEADEVFARGRRLYPRDPGLFRFGLSLDRAADPSERQWIERNASEDPEYLAALLDFILISPSASERRELLTRYFDAGGDHPMAYAAFLEIEAASSAERDALERFLRAEAYRDRSALRLAAQVLAGAPEEQRLVEVLEAFSGRIVEDDNRDGFFESRMELREGELSLWEIDRRTDGTIEWRLEMHSGVPTAAEHTVNGSMYRVHFFDYPEVAAVSFESEAGRPLYHLVPGSTDFLVVPPEQVRRGDTLRRLAFLRLVDAPTILSAPRVARAAYLVDFHDPEGRHSARVLVDGSAPVRRFEDSGRDGRIDRVVDYEAGLPVAGVRDLDGDGYFEVTEQYLGGELALILVDEDDDFVVEYTESPGNVPEGAPAVYSWDLDEDGLVDMQEIIRQQDDLLGEFASSAPGVFDITFEDVGRVFAP